MPTRNTYQIMQKCMILGQTDLKGCKTAPYTIYHVMMTLDSLLVMDVTTQREVPKGRADWVSDETFPFVIVAITLAPTCASNC